MAGAELAAIDAVLADTTLPASDAPVVTHRGIAAIERFVRGCATRAAAPAPEIPQSKIDKTRDSHEKWLVLCQSCYEELHTVAGAELAAIDAVLANTLCRPAMPRSSRTGASPRNGPFRTGLRLSRGSAPATRNPSIDD